MAISKQNSVYNKTSNPEALYEIPQPGMTYPDLFRHEHHKSPKLEFYDSFEDAMIACNRIFLSPGEVHTEFYTIGSGASKEYHCVVAIGNLNPNKGHLFLTDTGSEQSISEQLDNILSQFKLYDKDFASLESEMENVNNLVNEFKKQLTNQNTKLQDLSNNLSKVENNLSVQYTKLQLAIQKAVATEIQDIKDLKAADVALQSRVSSLEKTILDKANKNDIDEAVVKINGIEEHNVKSDTSISQLEINVKGLSAIKADKSDIVSLLDDVIAILDDLKNIATSSELLKLREDIQKNADDIEKISSKELNDIDNINASVNAINKHNINSDASISSIKLLVDKNIVDIQSLTGKNSVNEENIQKNNNEIETLKNNVSKIDVSISLLEGKLQENEAEDNLLKSSLSDQANKIQQLQSNVIDINQSIQKNVEDVSVKFNNVNSSILNIKNDLLISINNEISALKDKDQKQDESLLLTNGSIVDFREDVSVAFGHVNSSILDIKNRFAPINDEISELKSKDVEISNTLLDVNNSIVSVTNELNSNVDLINSSILNIKNNISEISLKLDSVKQHDELVDNQISSINDEILNINRQFGVVNSSISNIKSDILEIQLDIASVNSKVDKQNTDISKINGSIGDVYNEISITKNEITNIFDTLGNIDNIADPSIFAYFHNDIYTVNLCCFTEGGHIEIHDEYPVEDPQCVYPADVYKTYREGDKITLTAIPNPGYKFVGWLRNAKQHDTKASIDVVFNNVTIDKNMLGINVIGTINDGSMEKQTVEHAPINNGYTALFKKLNTIKVTIITDPANPIVSGQDTVSVKINGKLTDENHYYFDGKAKITITAGYPEEVHDFVKYDINGQIVTTAIKTFEISESVEIKAYFKEVMYYVAAKESPIDAADIVTEPHSLGYLLKGTKVKFGIKEGSLNENYIFDGWYDEDESITEPYSRYMDYTTIINKDTNIVAKFILKN